MNLEFHPKEYVMTDRRVVHATFTLEGTSQQLIALAAELQSES